MILRRLHSTCIKTTRWFSHRSKIILVSIVNVILLMFLTYFLNNQPLFTGENLFQYSWVEYFKGLLGINQSEVKKDAVFINVGYDKKLIDKNDEFGLPLGNTPITDRQKLVDILRMLNKTDAYQYIFLDVVFEKGFEDVEVDSLLLDEIKHTKRIVVATHPDVELLDSVLNHVAAWNNDDATIVETNFKRYEYSALGKPSMPLFAYSNLTGKSIKRKGLFYFCDGKLCYNSLFTRFPIEGNGEYGENDVKQYYNLGSDILNNYTDADLAVLCKAKYVFIGDMIEDLHDTYSGLRNGPSITYYAFKELMNGKHFVNYLLSLFLAIIYFCISVLMFNNKSWFERIPWMRKVRYKSVRFFMSFIGFSFVLTISAILLGILFNTYISILIPSLYFTIQKTLIDYKRIKI